MARKKNGSRTTSETFTERLIRLREEAGFTQSELATELGISRRMMHYYEKQVGTSMTELLPELARALGVTTDQLLGLQPITPRRRPKDSRLSRRLQLVEKLPPEDRRHISQMIDALVERRRLRDRASA